MKTTKRLLLALFVILAAIGCRKDTPNTGGNGGGNGGGGNNGGGGQQGAAITSLTNFWKDQKASKIQNLTATAGVYSEVVGAKGTKLTLYSSSFLLNGVPVTSGTIAIKLIEAYDKADIILMGLNTMGRDAFGNYEAMVSGGEFYLEASQNGQVLSINPSLPLRITTAPFPNADFNNNMIPLLLEVDTTVAGDSVWVPIDSTRMSNCQDSLMINLGQSTYCFEIGDNARWINCDYFARWNTTLTGLTVSLPSTFDNTNTQVLLSFDGLNMVTKLNYAGSNSFSLGTYYQAPVGQAVHIVVIAEQNGTLLYNTTALTLASNQTSTIASADIVGTTIANLQTQLNNLP